MEKYCVVKTIVANLYKQPSFTSELVTQALLKEKLLILDQKNNWYKIRQWDNYESWIHSFYIGDIEEREEEPYYRGIRNRGGGRRWFSDKFLRKNKAMYDKIFGNNEIIHSSGCVKIENLKDNKKLNQKLCKIMSITKIINE